MTFDFDLPYWDSSHSSKSSTSPCLEMTYFSYCFISPTSSSSSSSNLGISIWTFSRFFQLLPLALCSERTVYPFCFLRFFFYLLRLFVLGLVFPMLLQEGIYASRLVGSLVCHRWLSIFPLSTSSGTAEFYSIHHGIRHQLFCNARQEAEPFEQTTDQADHLLNRQGYEI
jgi:hypothetical protein